MPWKTYRPILAAVVALIFYTVTDILIWQRIFEAKQMVEYANTYHTGWFVSLAGYAVMGILLMWGDWKDCLYFLITLLVSAFSGMEDLLYYLLDRRSIPDSLPWLAHNPMIFQTSRTGLIVSEVFWVFALLLLYFVFYKWKIGQFGFQSLRDNQSTDI